MERWDMRNSEGQLDALLSAYREAIPDPEAGPDFMPGLWEKIDGRRRFAYRLARGLVTAAAAASLLMGIALFSPSLRNPLVYSATYVDVLDDDRTPELLAYAEIHPDQAGDVTIR